MARRRHVDGQQRRRVDGRRGPAVHPLHVREHGRAQGHRPRDGRLHGRRGPLVPDGLRRADARGRRLVLHGRLRLDHGPHLRRLRPPAERRDADRLRGRAVVARRGPPLAHRRPAQGDAPLHGADGDPRAHALRRRTRHVHVARVAQAAGLRRRAHQPRGLAVVPRGRGRRPLPRRAFRGVPFVFLSFFLRSPRRGLVPRRPTEPRPVGWTPRRAGPRRAPTLGTARVPTHWAARVPRDVRGRPRAYFGADARASHERSTPETPSTRRNRRPTRGGRPRRA